VNALAAPDPSETKERIFEGLLNSNKRPLMAIARAYAPGEEGRDLYQEILLQLWRGLDGFAGRSQLNTWVYRVALNTALSQRRKSLSRPTARQAGHQDTEEPAASADTANPGRELVVLRHFLGVLGDIDRAVLLLYLEDLSYRQMAEITGLSEGHIGARISRLKEKFIKRYLGA